jgi:hemolysin activation/secretion protein
MSSFAFLVHAENYSLLTPIQNTLPSQVDQSRQRVPESIPGLNSNFDFRLESTERSPIPKAVDSIKFKLNDIQIEGSSIYSEDQLRYLFEPLLKREVVLEDVRGVADKLELKYREKGYFLARVFIPPQQVKGGKVNIKVIEGYIASILVEGASEELRATVKRRLTPLLDKKPIDLPSLERALLLLNDLPGVRGSGLLRAGQEFGSTDLVVQIDYSNFSGVVSANNQSSRALGPVILSSAYQFRGLLSLSDELTLQLGISSDGHELSTQSVRYQMPFGRDGLIASIGLISSVARPGANFAALGLQSNVLSSNLSARYPLVRARSGSVFAELGFNYVDSRTSSQGTPLFQESYLTHSAGLQFTDVRSALGLTQLGLGVSRASGVNATLASTDNYDPSLRKYTYNMHHVISFESGLYAQVDLQGQWADKPLLSGERIAFGGAGIGKGFDPSTIVGDRGAGSSLEAGWGRMTVAPWGNNSGQFQIFGFHDNATAKILSTDSTPTSDVNIQSSGVGLRWLGSDGVRSTAYLAKPMQTNDSTNVHTESMYFNLSVPW